MKLHSLSYPSGRVIFCDDIRMELFNKTTLVGIYNGDLLFPSEVTFPTALPKMGIAMSWNEPLDGCSRTVSFQATLVSLDAKPEEEGKLLAESKHEISEQEVAKGASQQKQTGVPMIHSVHSYFVISPVAIPGPCKIRVRVIRDDGEWMVGALRLMQESND